MNNKNMLNNIYKTIILLLFCNTIFALKVQENPVNGGVKFINFTTHIANPKAYFLNKEVLINKIKTNHFQAIIGIPINAKIGTHTLTIESFNTKYINFTIKEADYKKQYITLTGKKKKFINPSKQHITRIIKEKQIIQNAKHIWNNKILANKFIKPTTGIITSIFGSQRFFNNKPKRSHSGIDFANNIGTKIQAITTGIVILTGDFYFNGKTVLIDHGQGLMSFYIHLNKITVKEGDIVTIGDKIGEMGSSGRTTGVNLHLSIYLNQVAVNPKNFIYD